MARHLEPESALDPAEADRFLRLTERLYRAMIDQQRAKVFRIAREAVPQITPEDVLNPHDFPELKAHPLFEFEDGLLAGLVAAQVAVRTEIKRSTRPDAPPPEP